MFTLTFSEAMQKVIDGKYVQAKHFLWSSFLAMDDGIVSVFTFENEDSPTPTIMCRFPITQNALVAKYREVSSLDYAGLFHF